MSALSVVARRSLAASAGLTVVLAATAVGISPAPSNGAADRGRACTVVGTPRADRLVGTPGPDVLCGRGGDDVLLAKEGGDVVRGGGGDDRVRGDQGDDVLLGGTGDDRLEGNGGADSLDGEEGEDVCVAQDPDRTASCVRDGAVPAVGDVSVSRDRIDVSDGPVEVVVTARVRDDAGVQEVLAGAGPFVRPVEARLTSGTRRAGTWSAVLTVPGWVAPQDVRPRVTARDRADGRRDASGPAVRVANDSPDRTAPEAQLLSPGPQRVVDVRGGGREVTVRVRLTDQRSGVRTGLASVYEPRFDGAVRRGESSELRRVSGTARDGIWEAKVLIRREMFSGIHQVVIHAADRASAGTRFQSVTVSAGEFGADEWNSAYWTMRAFPGDRGGFRVLGRQRPDVLPPILLDASASPGVVDTSVGGGRVRVTADVVDDRSGVRQVHVDLVRGFYGDPGTDRYHARMRLAEGTPREGRWRASIPVPRGARDGRLWVMVTVVDGAQMASEWVSETLAGAWPFPPIASDPSVVVTPVREDGPQRSAPR